MKPERRKHVRRSCGFIIDYQHMEDENGNLSRRAASINVSKEGLCMRSAYEENENDVLLLNIPYVTPNPGIFAAKVKHAVKTEHGFLYGLYVLPLFQERYSVIDTISLGSESIELAFDGKEAEFLRNLAGDESLVGPVLEGVCAFWNELNPKIGSRISTFEELTEFLSGELEKRRKGG